MFNSSRKKAQEILDTQKHPKEEDFDFERIKLLFDYRDKSHYHQVISDRTCRDLDIDELFMSIDRTSSRIGQQYLYYALRTIPKDSKRSAHFEKIIEYFRSDPDNQNQIIIQLNRLNEHGAYFLQRLIYGENLEKPKWFWVIPLLSGLSIGTLILLFIYPIYPLFILIVVVNFVIHFWNKSNLLNYSNTVPQLIRLKNVAKELTSRGDVLGDKKRFVDSFDQIQKITKTAAFLSWESRVASELGQIGEYFFELLKGSFLLEPILTFRIVEALEQKRKEIEEILISIGEIDAGLSIAAYRESLPFYTKPDISQSNKTLVAVEMYHPLIPEAVFNSINLKKGKSVLISGSNMSGKTTFIRTIGINVILAQTINTVCARSVVMPPLKIHSAVRIADDLFNETSYYYEEVKVIKEMIRESETEDQNLFLLDELFKGTNTIERVASGKAVLSYLNQKNNIVFASTHDLELTDLLSDSFEFYHFEESVDKDELVFDYKLKDGKWTHTNAIRILEVNGFPKEVTGEAEALAQIIKEKKTR